MTFFEVYKAVTEKLSYVSDCPEFEAKCLLNHFYSVTPTDIYSAKECDVTSFEALNEAVNERLNRVPLQYILGSWHFMDYEFLLNENVLIPRPETELLTECLKGEITAKPDAVIYDLCSGSGCIAVSISKLYNKKVYALEKYEGALEILKKNIKSNGADVTAVCADICEKPSDNLPQADFIFSNPPYIKTDELNFLQPEVKKEPLTALDGGIDGLQFYRAIKNNWLCKLNSGGYLALEIGEEQNADVKGIFCELKYIKTIKDYGGHDRVVIFKKG